VKRTIMAALENLNEQCSPISSNEIILFGDFNNEEALSFFANGTLSDDGVKFECPAELTTSTWVEEGRKHTFLAKSLDDYDVENTDQSSDECSENYKAVLRDMEHTPIKLSSSCNMDDEEEDNGKGNSPKTTKVNGTVEEEKSPTTESPAEKPSSWASLFKGPGDATSSSKGSGSNTAISINIPQQQVGYNTPTSKATSNLTIVPLAEDKHANKLADFIV